jgi:hypothetical protein
VAEQKFRARLVSGGKYGKVTFVRMPFDIRDVWGRAVVPVKGRVNGVSFRTTVGRKGGAYVFCSMPGCASKRGPA